MIRKIGCIGKGISLPVLKKNDGKEAITNVEKAKMLAKGFFKEHSSQNLSKG